MSMRKVLFYGDSNTYGYDPRGYLGGRYPESSRWPNLLQAGLGRMWKIESDGMNGRTIPYMRFQIEGMLNRIECCAPLDLFAIFLGTNDLWNMPTPQADVPAARMEHVLSLVREMPAIRDNGTGILIMTPPRMRMDDNNSAYLEASRQMAERFAEIAQTNGDLLADAYSWNLDLAYDGVHLSERGHRQLAVRMTEYLLHLQR